jgi:hypothetical protein
MSNRRAACSRHVGCFCGGAGMVSRFVPGPREAGAGKQNARDESSRWSLLEAWSPFGSYELLVLVMRLSLVVIAAPS